MVLGELSPLHEFWRTVAWTLAAIGTVLVALVAVFGEQVRNRLFGPRLTVSIHDRKWTITSVKDKSGRVVDRAIYVHLAVRNKRARSRAANCVLFLTRAEKQLATGEFRDVGPTIPLQLIWAPALTTPSRVTVLASQVADLGAFSLKKMAFELQVYSKPNDFEGDLTEPGMARYWVHVESDGLVTKDSCIEVKWTGTASEKADEMGRHLTVQVVDAQAP